MSENKQQVKFEEPYNPADPIVLFDPMLHKTNIVTTYQPSNDPEYSTPEKPNNQDNDMLKQDGVRYPLIRLNNINLKKDKIQLFKLDISGFLPTIYLEVIDDDQLIQNTDTPGMNNNITVVMIAPVNGANKKISIDFYITKCEFVKNVGRYHGEYKLMALKREILGQVGTKELTTYEYLNEIAKECGLGFASSYGCHDVNDARWRQLYRQTYVNFIKDQITFGGLDENSVFDAWIDQFGYLTLVNLAKIFNDDTITEKNLVTKMIGGETMTADNLKENKVKMESRMITNSKTSGISNLLFEKYKTVLNNEKQLSQGTLRTLQYMSRPGDTNKINTLQVQVIENSIDGVEGILEYEYNTIEFIGVEMSDTPILTQKIVVEAFYQKYFNKFLYVELTKPNYNLQRGMLLTVALEEYEPGNKRVIIDNSQNAITTTADSRNDVEQKEKDENTVRQESNAVLNDAVSITNPALSGIYYIHSIGFKWKPDMMDIQQYMYLAKKGITNNIYNKYAKAKV